MMDKRSLDKVFNIKFSAKIPESQAHRFKVGLLSSQDGIERPCRVKIRLLDLNGCPVRRVLSCWMNNLQKMHFADQAGI